MMKKPKVAFIHPAIGESLGGSQVFVLELAERLRDRCDITILSAKKVNDLCKPIFTISRGKSANSNQFFLNLTKQFLRKIATSPEVVLEHLTSFSPVLLDLLLNDYDVIFPNNDWGGLLVASVARHIKGTPILFTEHCGFMEKGSIASRNLKFSPDKYIVLSMDLKFWIKKYYPHINVEYIPNGVNFSRFNPRIDPQELDLPKPIILTASRYSPNKRLELIIDAVAKLNKGSLLILSSGKNLDSLKSKGSELLGDERFRIMSVPYNLMGSYYRACDLFTLPSLYEPFGLVYLEAMACNLPIVAPNDSSRIDIIGEAGLLCEVTDTDIYAETINKTLNTDFGDIPYTQAKKFTWESCADQYYEIILSMTKNKCRESKEHLDKDYSRI